MYLQKIQKVLNVFIILTTVYMVCAFVAAGFLLVSGIIGLADAETLIFKMGDINVYLPTVISDELTSGAACIAESIAYIFLAILAALIVRFLKKEKADGTPITEKCADRLKSLGITAIVCTGVSSIVQAAVLSAAKIDSTVTVTELDEILLGISFIIFSMIIRYAAQNMKQTENTLSAEKSE